MPSGFKRDINSLTGMNDPSSGDPVEHVQELQENIRRLEARLAILEQKPDASAPVSVKSRGPAFEGENGIYVQATDSRVLIGKFDEPTLKTSASGAFRVRSKELDVTAPDGAVGLIVSVSKGLVYEGNQALVGLSGYETYTPWLVNPITGTTQTMDEDRLLAIPAADPIDNPDGKIYYLYELADLFFSETHSKPSHKVTGVVRIVLSAKSPTDDVRKTYAPIGESGILWSPIASITVTETRVIDIQYIFHN
jgi:hypothetical protein